MTEQPEALRLADDLDAYHTRSLHKEAAIELRRLHAEIEAAKKVESHLFHEGARRGNRVVALEKAARMALAVLEQWDDLIEHQYTGSRAAMTDMHYAAQATVPVLEALREVLEGKR